MKEILGGIIALLVLIAGGAFAIFMILLATIISALPYVIAGAVLYGLYRLIV